MSNSPPSQSAHLGSYTVFRRIAKGQRSVVWAATSRQFSGFARTVAIKCMTPAAALVSEQRQAFMFEATIGGGIHHPNVAHVFDVGVWQGRPYMVMELVGGWPLRAILATSALTKRSIPLPAALSMLHTAAEGLHFVHGMTGRDGRLLGLVHRGVDDTNVLVARTGHAKIIDFGLAVPTAITHAEPLAARERSAMSAPELDGPRPVDCRADIYALGKLLERLCDRMQLPFTDDVRAVVARATAPKLRNRFDNARDFQRSLEAVAAARDLTITPGAAARFLEQLYSPTQRIAEGTVSLSLPGLAKARSAAQRKSVPNAGRTRVRVTRDRSPATAIRAMVQRRRASTVL